MRHLDIPAVKGPDMTVRPVVTKRPEREIQIDGRIPGHIGADPAGVTRCHPSCSGPSNRHARPSGCKGDVPAAIQASLGVCCASPEISRGLRYEEIEFQLQRPVIRKPEGLSPGRKARTHQQ